MLGIYVHFAEISRNIQGNAVDCNEEERVQFQSNMGIELPFQAAAFNDVAPNCCKSKVLAACQGCNPSRHLQQLELLAAAS